MVIRASAARGFGGALQQRGAHAVVAGWGHHIGRARLGRIGAAAIDQMLLSRDAGKLELPLKGHGYLYAVIASSADRIEAQAEHQREAERAAAARARAHSSDQPTDAGQLLQAPAPAQPQPPRPASTPGTSPAVRRIKEEIARKKGHQP